MPHNSQLDSQQFESLNFPYNRVEHELSGMPRFIRGENAYVTYGGKTVKRPGTLEIATSTVTGRADRLWIYETMEDPPKVYTLASVKNPTSNLYSMFYKRMDSSLSGWLSMGGTRALDSSFRPHEVTFSRGLAFIKSYPIPANPEKLGSSIFDGSGTTPAIKLWGLLGPTTPAAMTGGVAVLTASVSASATTFPVDTVAHLPVTFPYLLQVEFEQVVVTSAAGLNLTVTRGVNGTSALAHNSLTQVFYRNWVASSHQVTVNLGWTYTYCYVSLTGQVSNRAPTQSNPDLNPSTTQPFFDLIPQMTLQGQGDTVNIPHINVYRTTDGGGTFYLVEQIANPGAGSFTYSDTNFPTGTASNVHLDPFPDSALDTSQVSPTLSSNSPPPTVAAPLVTGVAPIAASSPIAVYVGRLWYGIGNILFYSAEEEITAGVPEESYPAGLNGNFFRFQYPIVNVAATADALYVFTLQATYQITGNTVETFSARPIFDNYGAPYGQPRAVARFADIVAFMTHDYRVAFIEGQQIQVISDPLYTDLVDKANINVQFDMKYWADLEKELLVITASDVSTSLLNKTWVYDIKKSRLNKTDFWNVPWFIRASAMASGRTSETSSQRRLVFAMWDDVTNRSGLSRLDPTLRTGTDWFIDIATTISFDIVTYLMQIPAGNHVNALRRPMLTPNVAAIMFDRTLFVNDADPQVYYYLDDLWTDPIQTLEQEDPPRRAQSLAYKTMLFPVNNVAQRFAVEIYRPPTVDLVEIQNLTVAFEPEAGA